MRSFTVAPASEPDRLAEIGFRARSVPSTLTTPLLLDVSQVAAPTGNPISAGTAAEGAGLGIRARQIVGDLDFNDRLDTGDAAGMLRLISGLEEVRSWDHAVNDVNGSGSLEPGDVIRVLRAVAKLEPQPDTGAIIGLLLDTPPAPGIRLESSKPWGSVGEEITVRVVLDNIDHAITGTSLTIDYPTEALRLVDGSKHGRGTPVPDGSLALWNLEPAQNYSAQTGRVHFAVSAGGDWAESSGVLAEFKFQIQPEADTLPLW